MPLIIFGVFVLVIAFLIAPLIGFMFTNPLVFGVSLIILGVLWIVLPKIFYGIIFCIVGPYAYWSENIHPKLKNKRWWQLLVKMKNRAIYLLDSDNFARVFIYGLIAIIAVSAVYFEYNPLVYK